MHKTPYHVNICSLDLCADSQWLEYVGAQGVDPLESVRSLHLTCSTTVIAAWLCDCRRH